MIDEHPTVHSLERHLAAVYRLMHTYLVQFVSRQAAAIDDEEFLDWLKDMTELFSPSEDRYGRFHTDFLSAAIRLQAMRLLAGEDGCARLMEKDYEEILAVVPGPLTAEDMVKFRDFRDDCLSHVSLTTIYSGMKGSEAAIAWRWVRAVEECAKAYGGDPDAIPSEPASFEAVLRSALTPAEYRSSLLTTKFKSEARELYDVQQRLVREDLARIWGVGAVP